MKSILTALGFAGRDRDAAAAQDSEPTELIRREEGKAGSVYTPPNFAEVEQEVIKAFNKRFPRSRWRMGGRRVDSSSPA